ncbi:MAG TPA: N-acetyl-gamma-glutamyl-phosphate reductase [Aggregatilineaceae bacterium]|nr:N-acetyl-gamma-glutamyl-phosphate reductase [Aggregatilineaceae bacterium]
MNSDPYMLTAGIAGASGYAGGELLRLLLAHPGVTVTQITSERFIGSYAYHVHPHLRGRTQLRFTSREALQPCDLLFLALPHGEAQTHITTYSALAKRIIDLSADFRLRDAAQYATAYGHEHAAPEWLVRFVYGLPELYREALRGACYASGVGCNATAVTLALWAVIKGGLLTPAQALIADIKVGSSEGGNSPTEASHHPARSGVVRPFALVGHRHEAEVRQNFAACGDFEIRMAVTSVEMVRGVAAAVYATLPTGLSERDLWACYRAAFQHEPFVRIVHGKNGLHRHPEPRLLAGTNYADVGWEYDPATGRAALICALDNLGKGAAGSAVQCLNLMCDWPETTGLDFGGIYP